VLALQLLLKSLGVTEKRRKRPKQVCSFNFLELCRYVSLHLRPTGVESALLREENEQLREGLAKWTKRTLDVKYLLDG
jgi:7,8-dihydro-6-hydroxymethylpterin-pyrophosphokinase